jgi:hypothetical protein
MEGMDGLLRVKTVVKVLALGLLIFFESCSGLFCANAPSKEAIMYISKFDEDTDDFSLELDGCYREVYVRLRSTHIDTMLIHECFVGLNKIEKQKFMFKVFDKKGKLHYVEYLKTNSDEFVRVSHYEY